MGLSCLAIELFHSRLPPEVTDDRTEKAGIPEDLLQRLQVCHKFSPHSTVITDSLGKLKQLSTGIHKAT
jgi:hypothetical protein